MKVLMDLYGLDELPNGSPRFLRQQTDLDSIASIFSGSVPSFEFNTIRDHHHLGQFHLDSTRPRPILVKLNQTSEVASLFFKKKSTENQIRPHSTRKSYESSSTQTMPVPSIQKGTSMHVV